MKSPTWQRKAGQSKSGGLNARGRASYNRRTGGNLKPPVSSKAAKEITCQGEKKEIFLCKNERHEKQINKCKRLLEIPIAE